MLQTVDQYKETLDRNKQIVRTWWDLVNKEDWDGMERILTDDFVWRTMASPHPFQSETLKDLPTRAVDRDKKATMEAFRGMTKMFRPPYQRKIYGPMTAEDDRVAYEATGYGVRFDGGRIYDQRYHDLVIVRDGKVAEFREYQDTLHGYDGAAK